ncbi:MULTISPECIES: PQQ-dependent catabolism-associated CXXCW motif protein [unclassified Bradyrhizobium]|uniref:PQQ-dependent catabolism-associated CXXCW motif protein n=1 Tax=unclassified Bradyrhizobium TaxID=2631580 RepID=UPI0028E6D83C|nr:MULTISPECIES: PQQ-dependent catabolism-associated CXXCW motif protein [unclassified Bradyrhizobium]
MSRRPLRVGVAAVLLIAAAHADDGVREPDDYRTENYRAPVPTTLAGARVLSTDQAEAIWRAKSGAFIDVLPRAPKPKNLPAGTVWRDQPRQDIPGSTWLPDTGYGVIAPATEAYLKRGLEQASGGDRARLLVFYCLANCWMSWNAAKRALSYGYANVAWYPEGTDGWAAADLPLAEVQPEPRSEE